MQQLNLDENNIIEMKNGFWRRQFQKTTESQRKFDWFFGVIMPVICFVFDPIVFKGNTLGTAFLANYKPFAYLLSFVSIMAMAAWLIWGAKLKWFNAFLAGLFFVGGLISLGIGIVLIPFSLLGLIILVGALGFTPLFTSFVFLRNTFRALQTSKPFLEKSVLTYAVAFSLIISAIIPWTINVEIRKSMAAIENGNAQTIYNESRKLKFVAPLVNFDNLISVYQRSAKGSEQSKAIAEVYNELTGEDIETKPFPFMD